MTDTMIVLLVFVVLLAVEWRYRIKVVRLGTAFLAAIVWLFSQPSPTRAARRAIVMSPAERVTVIQGNQLSEYASGVATMEQAAGDDAMGYVRERLLSVGVLLWLACSPVFRSAPLSSAPDGAA